MIPELADVDKEIESIPKPECGLHDLLSATVANISTASAETSATNYSRVETPSLLLSVPEFSDALTVPQV